MPWYPLAGQIVEPVVHFGGGGHGLTRNPSAHIGFLGLGSWALRAVLLEWAVWWPWGESPGPALTRPSTSVLHATALNP